MMPETSHDYRIEGEHELFDSIGVEYYGHHFLTIHM